MKLGVLSDIHADLASLDRALHWLEKACVDQMVCLGDLVERGTNGDAVIQRIRDRSILCVQGNHDENAVRHAALTANLQVDDNEVPAILGESIDFLKRLPATKTLSIGDAMITLAHAIPSDNGASVFQDNNFNKLSKRLRKDLSRIDVDFLIVGHTHFPMDLEYRSMRILNPGSVCNLQARDSHTFGILDLSELSFDVFAVSTGEPCELLCRRYD